MTNSTPQRIVIVGASLAGLRGAQALREFGFDGALTLLGEEPHLPYDRPPLSKQLLAGEQEPADIRLRGVDALNARLILGDRAVALDTAQGTLTTASGEVLRWDRLLLATGSRPRRLPVLDTRLEGVHELRTLEDALALRAALADRPRLVIVGAGFIGIEVAATARNLGLEVEVVTLDPPLAPAGPLISSFVTTLLDEQGIGLRQGRTVVRVLGTSRAERLELDDGSTIEADLVLSAVGVRPAVDWLAGSGVILDDGVVCDPWCAVLGVPGVAAAGDVAHWPHPGFGPGSIRIEHWNNAAEQARTAANTLLRGSGHGPPYAPVPSFWSDHFGLRLQSIGLPALGTEHELHEGDPAERRFVVAARRDGRLVGSCAYGRPRALLALRREFEAEAKPPVAPVR